MNDLSTPIDFLLTRRSSPAKVLQAPVPEGAALDTILTAAARVPDHGKLAPWRFAVLGPAALTRLADLTIEIGVAQGRDPGRMEKAAETFRAAPLVVAVISKHDAEAKIPLFEQQLSAGAACAAMVNAALASGFGAAWLTGWVANDAEFNRRAHGIEPPDFVAGYIHLGTPSAAPPERPRPDLADIVIRVDA